MPWDIPDEGGSKGPEEPEEGMEVKRPHIITNLEGAGRWVGHFDDDVDPDTGKLNKFFRELGNDSGADGNN